MTYTRTEEIYTYLSVPKVIFFSPPLSVDPFQVASSPLSHSCCNLLHSGIPRSNYVIIMHYSPPPNSAGSAKEKAKNL